MALEISVDADLLILSGRLDAAGAIALDAWKTEAATVPALWDLRALAFISSLGIRSLITLDRRVRAAGQRVQVVMSMGSMHGAFNPFDGIVVLHGFVSEAKTKAAIIWVFKAMHDLLDEKELRLKELNSRSMVGDTNN
jgi:ABC-type transporter Mla MlaB component